MDEDYQLALLLQNELNKENGPEIIQVVCQFYISSSRPSRCLASDLWHNVNDLQEAWKGKEVQRRNDDKKTHSLVDPQWEFIDPTPDIHVLFLQFNDRFFWGKLHTVEVKWSSRMTSLVDCFFSTFVTMEPSCWNIIKSSFSAVLVFVFIKDVQVSALYDSVSHFWSYALGKTWWKLF